MKRERVHNGKLRNLNIEGMGDQEGPRVRRKKPGRGITTASGKESAVTWREKVIKKVN